MTKSLVGDLFPQPLPNVSGQGIAVSRIESPPIVITRWIRNGKHPNAILESMIGEAVNQAVMYRTKTSFAWATLTGSSTPASAGAGDRNRWRFAFHSGPYTHAVNVIVQMQAADTGLTSDAYTRLDLGNGVAVTTSEQFHFGPSPYNGTVYGIDNLLTISKIVSISPDTDYYGTFVDVDNGRLYSACVTELASMTQFPPNGYLPQNFAATGPILDAYRENEATILRNLWRRAGAHVIAWTSDTDAVGLTTSGVTPLNVLDTSVTTISPSSPGYTLDMRGKDRSSQTTGVPVAIRAYCSNASLTPSGSILLKNSAGATVLSLTNQWSSAGASWGSATGLLPASVDKYDLQFSSDGVNNFTVYAASLFEYEA